MAGCGDLIKSYLSKADELDRRADELYESRMQMSPQEYKHWYRRVRVLREEAEDLRYSAHIMRKGVRFNAGNFQSARCSVHSNGD